MAVKPSPYWEYIRVEALLSLQAGTASTEAELANDEVRFIVVHQSDELWFKLVLREMVSVRDLFTRPTVPEQALASARSGGWLTPDALIIVEESAKARFAVPEGFVEHERRRYDDTEIIVLGIAAAPSAA